MKLLKQQIVAALALAIMIVTYFSPIQTYAATSDKSYQDADCIITVASSFFDDFKINTSEIQHFGIERISQQRWTIDDMSTMNSGIGTVKIAEKDANNVARLCSLKQSITSNGYPIYRFDIDDSIQIESNNEKVVQYRELSNGQDVIQIRSKGTAKLLVRVEQGNAVKYYSISFIVRK